MDSMAFLRGRSTQIIVAALVAVVSAIVVSLMVVAGPWAGEAGAAAQHGILIDNNNSDAVRIDEGDSATFDVKLSSAPDGYTVVNLTGSRIEEVLLSHTSLIFTEDPYDALGWNQAQTVTIIGKIDDVDDPLTVFPLTLTASGGGVYNGLENGLEIIIKHVAPVPTATPTPTPAPTATSTPTPTPAPTATSTPTPTPAPTATSTPTPTPAPTATSTPTPTPVPADTTVTTIDPFQTGCTRYKNTRVLYDEHTLRLGLGGDTAKSLDNELSATLTYDRNQVSLAWISADDIMELEANQDYLGKTNILVQSPLRERKTFFGLFTEYYRETCFNMELTISMAPGTLIVNHDMEIKVAGQNERCLDVKAGSISNGQNVQNWSCNDTDAQTWKLVPYDTDGYQIKVKKGDYSHCLDTRGDHTLADLSNSRLDIWDCVGEGHGAKNNQKFYVEGVQGENTFYIYSHTNVGVKDNGNGKKFSQDGSPYTKFELVSR